MSLAKQILLALSFFGFLAGAQQSTGPEALPPDHTFNQDDASRAPAKAAKKKKSSKKSEKKPKKKSKKKSNHR